MVVLLCVLNNSNENRTDKIIKSEKISWAKTRTNESMKNNDRKNETKRKLSYTLPIKRTGERERELSSCFHMFGIASRDNVLPFSFLALSALLWVPYVALEPTVLVSERVCVCFSVFIIPTDWLLQLLHYPIHSFSCRLEIYSSVLVSSTVRNVSCVSFFMFVCIIQNIETRITTNMFVEFWAKGTCVRTPKLSAYFRLCPFWTSYFSFAMHQRMQKVFLGYRKWWHWRSRKGDRNRGKKTGKNTGKWVI